MQGPRVKGRRAGSGTRTYLQNTSTNTHKHLQAGSTFKSGVTLTVTNVEVPSCVTACAAHVTLNTLLFNHLVIHALLTD
jgi:hypothetical protein